MSNLITVPKRYSNIYDGDRQAYTRAALSFLNNKENWVKGRKSLAGFTKQFGYLKENNQIFGPALNKGEISFPNKIDQLKSKQKSEGKRAGNLYGFTPETEEQVAALNKIEELKAEYKEKSEFGTPNQVRNAEKEFHNQMRKVFKKHYKAEKYDPNRNYGWPEGKSVEGYEKWQRWVFNRLKGVEGKDVDHGKTAARGGTNSLTNLSQQDSIWNRYIKQNKFEFIRTDEGYDQAGIAFDKLRSFQEYLAFQDDDKIQLPEGEVLEKLHKHVGVDPDQIISQGWRDAENKALTTYNNGGAINVRDLDSSQLTGRAKHEAMVKETKAASIRDSQFKDQSQENLEGLQNFAEDLWGAGMDSAGLGAVKNTIYAGKAVLDKDPVGIVTNAAAVIPELKIVTDEPLIKTKLTHKVNQLPMAM